MKTVGMKLRMLYCLLPAVMLSAGSCIDREMETGAGAVRFRFAEGDDTRSGINPDVNTVKDVNIAVYRYGVLQNVLYFDKSKALEMTLDSGEYTVYAVGNIGEQTVFPNYEELLPRWKYRISSTSELKDKGMAFTASKTINVSKDGGEFILKMTRMAARCGFRFDASALKGMKVKSVRLRQAALDMAPFGPSGSIPDNVEDAGDYASETDLVTLNNGGTVYFYCLENDRGVLLPDNTDIWGKVPDKIPDVADKCTYIEVAAAIADNPDGYSGEVIYRFYLGKNTTSDFSVVRNTCYTVSLTTSEDGLDKRGWLIDTSGLWIDPLFNFNPPDIPEYVGQWVKISFPNAGENRTVRAGYGEDEIIVGAEHNGVDSLFLDNGAALFYAPEVSTKDIYLYLSALTPHKTSPVSTLTFQSRESSVIMQIPAGTWPTMTIADKNNGMVITSATVNEDGLGVCRADMLLNGKDGNPLSPLSFAMPDEIIAGAMGYYLDGNIDVMGRFANDFIRDIESGIYLETTFNTTISPGKAAGIQMLRPDSFSGKVSAEAVIYGKAEGTEIIAAGRLASDGGMSLLSKVNCTVNEAFPNQGYLGSIHNTQLDICSPDREGHTELHSIDIYNGAAGSENVTWYVFRTDPGIGTNPGTSSVNSMLSGHNNLKISKFQNGIMELALLPPEPDESASPENPFFACGAFCLRGTIVNPYTRTHFIGTYILDIILDISITAQLDFLPGYLGFYYVPYNVHYASIDYAHSWKNNLPVAIRPVNLKDTGTVGSNDRISSSISGDKPVGLVPVTASNISSKGSLEYRTKYCNTDYGNNNDFPFSESNGALACRMLAGTFIDNDGNSVTTDIGSILSFKICPLNQDGSIMSQLDNLQINRSNYSSFPAFEGFYNITRGYDNFQGTGSSLDNVGKYVIEASEKARSLETPFLSNRL